MSAWGADWHVTSVTLMEPAAPFLAVPGLSHLVVGAGLSDAYVMTGFQEGALSREGGLSSVLQPSLGITQHDPRHICWAGIGWPGFNGREVDPVPEGSRGRERRRRL